nr:putative cytochrome C oxidase subunit 5B-like [Ipomoea batatas]
MPIATGHEREELEAELQGKKILDIDFPEGPFGTKEAPAVVKSYYDKRIVGCPGGEGEDEHDVVFGFGWRRASHMNVLCVHNILCWWDCSLWLQWQQLNPIAFVSFLSICWSSIGIPVFL